MNGNLQKMFERMGARVRVHDPDLRVWRRWGGSAPPAPSLQIDVRTDRRGEYFDIAVHARAADLSVLDVRPRERHLLLLSRQVTDGTKEKFLCGHDERHWFVAAVPGTSAVSVATAMEALKPAVVREAQDRLAVRARHRNRRHNPAFVRQGEWFFVPTSEVPGERDVVLSREPLQRGAGTPHMVESLFRTGGVTVYVSHLAPNGLTEPEYRALLRRRPTAVHARWEVMRRDAGVFAKGRVWHPDHRTIVLPGWHRVLPNTESSAAAMRHLAFLD